MTAAALRWFVMATVLAVTGSVCVDILPASAQQSEIVTQDRKSAGPVMKSADDC